MPIWAESSSLCTRVFLKLHLNVRRPEYLQEGVCYSDIKTIYEFYTCRACILRARVEMILCISRVLRDKREEKK
jgi:hypothetical protein